ncbi:MAG TPA: carbamoyl phosphate synthase small subunit, partial [Candidatus Subteraquimicrobiales bacterium]
VRRIRVHGAMKGVISSTDLDEKSLINKAKNATGLLGRDLVKGVTCDRPYLWNGQQVSDTITDKRFKVVAFDFGIKLNILRELTERGCEVKVVPAAASAEEVLGDNPDGIFLSNGPGDPKGVFYAVETLRKLLGKVPVFGICLGHQLLALALGGETYKLKFGHRGGNHPVKNLLTEKVEITTQNHGFAVDPTKWGGTKHEVRRTKVLPGFGRAEITHINLNNGTVEGLRGLDIPAFSVQYHPEASPGPHDSKYLFSNFIDLMSDIK